MHIDTITDTEHTRFRSDRQLAFLDFVSNVDGSMLGKSLSATGRRNSMKGTMMKTRKGRSLKTSAHVLRNCVERGRIGG